MHHNPCSSSAKIDDMLMAFQPWKTCWWLFSPENHAFQQILAFHHVRIFRLRLCPRKGNVPALAPGQCRTCQCRKLTTCWKAPYWVLLKSRSWKAEKLRACWEAHHWVLLKSRSWKACPWCHGLQPQLESTRSRSDLHSLQTRVWNRSCPTQSEMHQPACFLPGRDPRIRKLDDD